MYLIHISNQNARYNHPKYNHPKVYTAFRNTATSSSEAITDANSESTVTFHNFELNSIFGPSATGCTQLPPKCRINVTSILNSIWKNLSKEICRGLILTTSVRTTRHYAYSSRCTAPAVGHRPLLAEAPFQSHTCPCGICGAQSGTGTGFSPITSGFPRQSHSHKCSIFIHSFIHSFITYTFSNSKFRHTAHINWKLKWRECIKIFHKTILVTSESKSEKSVNRRCQLNDSDSVK